MSLLEALTLLNFMMYTILRNIIDNDNQQSTIDSNLDSDLHLKSPLDNNWKKYSNVQSRHRKLRKSKNKIKRIHATLQSDRENHQDKAMDDNVKPIPSSSLGSSSSQTNSSATPRVLPKSSALPPTSPNSSQYQNFIRLYQLFPQLHPSTISGALALCNNDLIRTIDSILYALQYRSYLVAKSKGYSVDTMNSTSFVFPSIFNHRTTNPAFYNHFTQNNLSVPTATMNNLSPPSTFHYSQSPVLASQPSTSVASRSESAIKSQIKQETRNEKTNVVCATTSRIASKRCRLPTSLEDEPKLKVVPNTLTDCFSSKTRLINPLVSSAEYFNLFTAEVEKGINHEKDDSLNGLNPNDNTTTECPLGDVFCNEICKNV